jgi:hypothetical protein
MKRYISMPIMEPTIELTMSMTKQVLKFEEVR